ncbi:MAG: MerC domain-containing protein [Cytophagales bacterium]|nr:MerC domain-containing protein [Cytophagales bacterium]
MPCIALPFLLTFAPLAGLEVLENPWIEFSFIAASFAIAISSLSHGYKKHHHKPLSLIVAGLGFLMISAGQLIHSEALEVPLMAAGGSLVAIAHLINWKHIQQSEVEYPDCCEE